MSEKFSPALRLADLNDFIAPSQACVVSLQGVKTRPEKVEVSAQSDFDIYSRPIICLVLLAFIFRLSVEYVANNALKQVGSLSVIGFR